MSADNWATCPQCQKQAEKAREKYLAKLEDSYGKVPLSTYESMRNAVPSGAVKDATLREDYEVGVDTDGFFYLSYSCGCDKCGFRHSEKINKLVLK